VQDKWIIGGDRHIPNNNTQQSLHFLAPRNWTRKTKTTKRRRRRKKKKKVVVQGKDREGIKEKDKGKEFLGIRTSS
jgi:hypothetical protein